MTEQTRKPAIKRVPMTGSQKGVTKTTNRGKIKEKDRGTRRAQGMRPVKTKTRPIWLGTQQCTAPRDEPKREVGKTNTRGHMVVGG